MIRTTTTTEAVCDRCGLTESVDLDPMVPHALRDGSPEGWTLLEIATSRLTAAPKASRGICPSCSRQFFAWWYRQAKHATDIGGRETEQ